jgi:adenosylhomocysteine nucleosidase
MIHNVFLDFFNRDSREIYGMGHLPKDKHTAFLIDALTVAIFLCRDHCILPPGFLAESALGREALINRRREYLNDRLVRLSMKEYSFDDFWNKKEYQYAPFREKYQGLFDPKNQKLLGGVSGSIIARNSNIANSILTGWEEAPDTNPIWRESIGGLGSQVVERIRRIPIEIANENTAITWPAIQDRIHEAVDVRKFRPVLQNVYFSAYITEYALKVLTSLPYISRSFVISAPNLGYDYEALKAALVPTGLWAIFSMISAESMIQLRSTGGYIRFREAFDTIATSTDQLEYVRKIFTLATETRVSDRRLRSRARWSLRYFVPIHGMVLPLSEIDEISERLTAIAERSLEIANDPKSTEVRTEPLGKKSIMSFATPDLLHSNRVSADVGILCVVADEMNAILGYLSSIGQYLEKEGVRQRRFFYESQMPAADGGVHRVVVTRALEQGNRSIMAAYQAMMDEYSPHLVVLVGIGGGIHKDARACDVVIAENIIYYDKRAITVDGPKHRMVSYAIKSWLRVYLNRFFDRHGDVAVLKTGEGTTASSFKLLLGPLGTGEAVIKYRDAEERKWLQTVSDKTLVLETEAGGLAQQFYEDELKTSGRAQGFLVLRGISDHADQDKNDSWRADATTHAMISLGELLKSIPAGFGTRGTT